MNNPQWPSKPPQNRKSLASRGGTAGLVSGLVIWFVVVRHEVGELLGYADGFSLPVLVAAGLWAGVWAGLGQAVGWFLNHRRGATLEGSAATGRPEGEAGAAPARAIPARSLGSLWQESWACFSRHWTRFYVLGVLSQAPVLMEPFREERPFPLNVLLLALVGLLGLLSSALMIYATACDQAGEEVSATAALARAVRRLPALLGSWVVFSVLLVTSALLMLVIVGIPLFVYLLVSLYFVQQAIMIEGAGPLAALRRSHALVKGSWWRVLGIGLAFMLVLVVPELVAGLGRGTVRLVIGGITTALGSIGMTLVYLDLRARKEGCPAERLAWELGGRVGASPEPPPSDAAPLAPVAPVSPAHQEGRGLAQPSPGGAHREPAQRRPSPWGFPRTIARSLYSPSFYATLPRRSVGSALGYFLSLCLLLTGPSAALYMPNSFDALRSAYGSASRELERFLTGLVDGFPPSLMVQVSDGTISASIEPSEEPYFFGPLGEPGRPPSILVIDTRTPVSGAQFEEYSAEFWLTGDMLYRWDPTTDAPRSALEDLQNLGIRDIALDRATLRRWVDVISPWANGLLLGLVLAMFPWAAAMLYVGYAWRLAYMLVAAFLILALLRATGGRMTYGDAYKAGLHGMTAALLVDLAVDLSRPWLGFSGFPFMFTLITLAVVTVNLVLARRWQSADLASG